MESSLDLEVILVGAVLVTGLIILLYKFFGQKNRAREDDPILLDYSKSFFPILLIVIIIRSFVAEPFRIPSGSMIPTLEIGDFILVKKYSYGIKLPVIHKKIIDIATPERGDVVVFHYPPNPKINYIKRLVGLPGDHIKWTRNKQLTINGKLVSLEALDNYPTIDNAGRQVTVKQYKETLVNDVSHNLIHFQFPSRPGEWDVPEGHYFMMGDNRDNSSDSRFWGFVPEENLVGKASFVWMHWNWLDGGDGFQYKRIGTPVE